MINKINGKPYPYMSLRQFLKYNLEGLNNTYSRQKEKAFYAQCHYAKHKKQDNRYKMNLNFRICSEYKKEIQIVNQWIKEIEKIEQVKKENEQLNKAREIIKNLLSVAKFYNKHRDKSAIMDITPIYEAEQFLNSEVEE